MTCSSKRILHIGLAGPLTNEQSTAGMTAEWIQGQVNKGAEKARQAGHVVEPTFFDPPNFSEALNKIKKELESGEWDALIIGGGLRATPSLTPQFEQVVNTAREAAPKTRLLFQMAPGDVFETIQRGFELK